MAKYELAFSSYFHFQLLEQSSQILQLPINSFVGLNANGIFFLEDVKKNAITGVIKFQ